LGFTEWSAHGDNRALVLFDPCLPSGHSLPFLCPSLRFGKRVPCLHFWAGFAAKENSEIGIVGAHAVSFLCVLRAGTKARRSVVDMSDPCPLLAQSRHFDPGPRSTSTANGFRLSSRAQSFTYAQHFHTAAFPPRENDYVRTSFINYPAQDHRSRTRRAGPVALRAKGRRD